MESTLSESQRKSRHRIVTKVVLWFCGFFRVMCERVCRGKICLTQPSFVDLLSILFYFTVPSVVAAVAVVVRCGCSQPPPPPQQNPFLLLPQSFRRGIFGKEKDTQISILLGGTTWTTTRTTTSEKFILVDKTWKKRKQGRIRTTCRVDFRFIFSTQAF